MVSYNKKTNKNIVLSAFVVVWNEEKRIEKCLKALDFCDEIIVIDQQSTDNTVKIAKNYAKVISDKHWGYPEPSRVLGTKTAKGKWILNVDADEIITSELAEEIREVIKKDNFDAYWIHRNSYFMNKNLKYLGADDYALRLHKKDSVIYNTNVHSYPQIISGKKENRLKYSIEHENVSAQRAIKKIKIYAQAHAESLQKTNGWFRKYFGIFYAPLFYFLYMYIYKKGFLDGKEGLIYCYIGFYYHLFVYKRFLFL